MVTTIGLAKGAAHLATGAKLVAPGIEVMAQIGTGVADQSPSWNDDASLDRNAEFSLLYRRF